MKAKIGNMVLYLLFKVILMFWRHRLAGILFLKGLSYLYMTQRAEDKSYSKQTQKSNGRECSLKLTQMFDHKKLVKFHKNSIQEPFNLFLEKCFCKLRFWLQTQKKKVGLYYKPTFFRLE